MNRAIVSTAILASLLAGFAAGIPAVWYGITRDWAATGRTILLAAVVVAIAICLLWMAPRARRLLRLYRRQP